MPLDEFKTQVLLLHSEQSTLDTLSSGFTDSYTVHLATSGSEALNTLVDTPINVIVSAHDLPGMSGLEALREAKKRSPQTVGILLAGNADAGLEALVGDKEVFQIVRGNVTSETILKLVDDATQQMRLVALAESANDTAVDVEDTISEHIVMETSENGSTIISDGTGRMRALDPAKVSAAASVGSQSVDLLVLTQDKEFLATIKESSRGMHTVHYANTLSEAVATIRKFKIGVAIVDAALVGDRIEQLTEHLRKGSARLVSIVAGRRDDGEMLMDLINRGKVYRFLLKPVSPGRARLAVEASVKYHLEAPEAAFKTKTPAAAAPPPAPPARAPIKATPKPASGPEAKAEQASKTPPATPRSTAAKESPPGQSAGPDGASPLHDGLADAFDGDDSSFTQTVTGLIGNISKRFTADEDAGKPEQKAASSGTASAATGSGGSFFKNPKILGIGAAAVVVIATTIFWFTGGFDDVVPEQAVVDAPAPVESEVAVDAPAAVAGNADAEVTEALALAETALLESRLGDANDLLQRVRSADPENARLPFLTAQLSQLQLRTLLTDARTAIRETQFDDADTLLAAARALGVADAAEIDLVANELSSARGEQRAEDVLAMANARLEDGSLISPPNDNARYFYELALSNDAENTAARQGLTVVATKLAVKARAEIDSDNLDSAEELLAAANAIDPANSELAVAVDALSDRREAILEQRRQAVAQRRAEADRVAAEKKAAEAARVAAEKKAAEAARVAAEKQAAEAARIAAEKQAAEAARIAAEKKAAEERAASQAAVPVAEKAAAPSNAGSSESLTAVSSLKRLRYVAPKYPRAAQRRNLTGWVDVVFTVGTDGLVKDIDVRESEPGDTFVNAAVKAVEKWEFEPAIEDGSIVEKRVGVRMLFALE
ncbi:MAG: TonB family protein [Gammaproteobacteria bacterium]|nr:TonB family protein [Gammaproteobacteria bacterium]MBT8110177.1 TonB family protein [Gammaproteobacteria bacterium]NND46761.1 TonB family protein [Woeseiaceae bacterium]NNL44880.1 TonB family protein [Woeseiaceae bacterium]